MSALPKKRPAVATALPDNEKMKAETRQYIEWIRKKLSDSPDLAKKAAMVLEEWMAKDKVK